MSFPSNQELSAALDKQRKHANATVYSCYCAAYSLAATGGEVEPLSARPEEHAVAVMLGAADGLTARTSNMYKTKSRAQVSMEVEALLAKPTVECEHGEEVLIRAKIQGDQIEDGEATGLIVVRTERGSEGAFLISEMVPT